MSHQHQHSHEHAPANYNTAFAIGVALNIGYVILEATFGVLSGSLALLADAGHNLSDVLGLLLAWGGNYLASLPRSSRYTYGFRSTSIMAALFNALILMVAVGGIVWEAIQRFQDPQPLTGTTVMWVAGMGVLVNGITTLLFVKGRAQDINIQGAFLHMAADTGVSLGVVLAGFVIYYTHWEWVDPAISLLVGIIIFVGTWGLLRDSVNLALLAVPKGIDLDEVDAYLRGLPGVEDLHDLHVWPMSTTETALTAHLVRPASSSDDAFLAHVCHELHDRFKIGHSTLQLERNSESNDCRLAAPDSV